MRNHNEWGKGLAHTFNLLSTATNLRVIIYLNTLRYCEYNEGQGQQGRHEPLSPPHRDASWLDFKGSGFFRPPTNAKEERRFSRFSPLFLMHPTQRLLPLDTDLDANYHGNSGSLRALVQPLLKTQISLDWLLSYHVMFVHFSSGIMCSEREDGGFC